MNSFIRLIVGLGNPGMRYRDTRHNVGFWLVDKLAATYKFDFQLENKFFSEIAKFKFNDRDILVLKPQTFMNLSGKAVQAVTNFYKIQASEVLVIHDELDFSCGLVRLKYSGGNGGHNGLRDIERVIGRDYWRMRIGISRPLSPEQVASYVLNPPVNNEKALINQAVINVIANLDTLLAGDINNITKILHTK